MARKRNAVTRKPDARQRHCRKDGEYAMRLLPSILSNGKHRGSKVDAKKCKPLPRLSATVPGDARRMGKEGIVWPPPKVGTFDVTKDGVVTFYLAIPCATSSPDRKSPLYLVETNSLGGPENGVWQCQECGAIRHTRKAWAKHAGMIPNIMGNCPGAEG